MDDVQSWWEIPCIAHFCSLFRLYFSLIDFDIEELEEALLTDSAEDTASSLLQDIIVRLLKGCFDSRQDEITTSNYQMYLRRLFRKNCEDGSTTNNPFETDAAFHSLPLRTKVEILYDLCDFRLDNEDVPESLKSLEADSLRVEPLGRDSGGSTYWYFYGTRLYREDYSSDKPLIGPKRGKRKEEKFERKWQVVCYTEEDWQVLTRKFKNCKSFNEKNLHRTLSSDFLPELPRLFAEKERLQRKRMLDQQLRRSGRQVISDQLRDEMPVASHKRANVSDNEKTMKNGDMDEDEARKQREEQEKADRLLAEEIEREERKARLHLRERRGGAVPSGSNSFTSSISLETSSRSSSTKKGSGGGSSRSSSSNKSPSKAPSKQSSKKEKSKKKRNSSGRMTNNSLAASIKTTVLSKGATKDDNDDNEVDEEEEEKEEEEESEKCEDDGEKENSSDDQEDSISRSSSPAPSKKLKQKKAEKAKSKTENSEKEKRSKSKDKDKKKRKLKKEKLKEKERIKQSEERRANKDKPVFDTNHITSVNTCVNSLGMSKTKVKSSVLFSQSEEDVQIGMHKVIEFIKNHGDAWPFMNAVDEDYAPNYYRVISSPMDLQTMEDKLDNQEYCSLDEFIGDFQRIVDNCIQYNGPSSEYTEMAETLQIAFNKSIQRYIVPDESDEEISIEYNNLGEKKRSRKHSHSTKEEKVREQKKENEPSSRKKSSTKTKSKSSEKRDKLEKKNKTKHKLMRHHSRDSEAIENLESATAETLKDMNRWLDDTPKPTEYVSSGAAAFDNLRNRILEVDNDRKKVTKTSTSVTGSKRKAEEITNNSSLQSRNKDKRQDSDDDEVDDEEEKEEEEERAPPKKMLKKSEKHTNKRKPNSEKFSKNNSIDAISKKVVEKRGKAKERPSSLSRHDNKHRHGSESNKKRNSSINNTNHSRTNGPRKVKKPTTESTKDEYYQSSPSESASDKPNLKHSNKSFDDKKQKTQVKKSNTLFNNLNKGPSSVKRLQQANKTTKFYSFNAESKVKQNNSGAELGSNKGITSENMEKSLSSGRDNGVVGEKPEKKKCLLLNDTPADSKSGPKLSLGTVLSTDAIKLGEFKKNQDEDEDEVESSSNQKSAVKSDFGETGTLQQRNDSKENVKEEENEPEVEDEEEETDRKLEPSKGFKPEKCLPNLSAWIKAFGGPTKAPPGAAVPVNSSHPRKSDSEHKSKFKVMGRGVGEPVSSNYEHGGYKSKGAAKHVPPPEPHWNSNHQNIKPSEHPQVVNLSEEMSSNEPHHNKKHRHRKMSTSSFSSQSETGSPHCFNNQENVPSGMGSVVNPPRWVDEHWVHAQSQSPSASSHVSSQSPANSPFSPAINSPPHTPQTPPRSGPVRVGFYQDITSQHSSPDKINEPHSNSNSNVASPSTPPTPTNHSTNNARREGVGSGTKVAFGNYSNPPVYNPRYSANSPSPNVGSNLHSPSPGGMGSVESPPGNPNSPHSPNVQNPPEYRAPSYTQSITTQHSQSVLNITSTRQVAAAHTSHHRSSVLGHHGGGSHSPAPSIAPYPPPPNHYGHPSTVNQGHPENAHSNNATISQAHQQQPAMAHMNQVQAHSQMSHQQHYDRYPPHNLVHHHQMNTPSGMPANSLPSSSSAYTHNITAAHSQSRNTSQPSPYTTNPYASNPRNINISPNVYNNPMSTDPAMNRFYKPTVSSGELSLTSTPSESHPTSSSTPTSNSRGRSSRSNNAAAAAAAAADAELARSTPNNLEGKLTHTELNGFQWPHNLGNLASLSQIVNSIPNPMNAVGMANAYRQYDQAMAESMSKYQRGDPSGYTNMSSSEGRNATVSKSSTIMHPPPPAAHSQPADKLPSDIESPVAVPSGRRQSSKAESKSRSQSSKSGQAMVAGSAFNFSSLSPADLAMYPKEISESGMYSASSPGLAHHRPDLYPTSTSSFHSSFSSSSRTTAGGVPTYQMPPFIGSHPSPYQQQTAQPFAHTQPPRGLVDPYQQFFQSSPHVMGLLPPSSYYPHSLGFNRPGWI